MKRIVLVTILVLFLLVACGGDADEQTQTPESVRAATSTPIIIVVTATFTVPPPQSTPTVASTSLEPTATPIRPTATKIPPTPTQKVISPQWNIVYSDKSSTIIGNDLWLLNSGSQDITKLTPKNAQALGVSRMFMHDPDTLVFNGSIDFVEGPYAFDIQSLQATDLVTVLHNGWWSRDEGRYVYISERSGETVLGAVDYDGSNPQIFTSDFATSEDVISAFDHYSQLTHDGNKLAFAGRRVEENGILNPFGLYVGNTEMGNNRRVASIDSTLNSYAIEPSLGHYISYLEGDHPMYKLRVIEVSSGKDIFVEPGGVRDWTDGGSVAPQFSPAESYLLYYHAEDGYILLNYKTGYRLPLRTLGGYDSVVISPFSSPFSYDGHWLVFSGQKDLQSKTVLLNTYDFSTTELVDGSSFNLWWSPNGRYLAYRVVGDDDQPGLRITSLDENPSVIGSFDGGASDLVWKSDSSALLFSSGGDGIYVWRLDIDGNPYWVAQCDTHFDCPRNSGNLVKSLAWSPDGLEILFLGSQNGDWGLYTVDFSGSNLRKPVPKGVKDAIWIPPTSEPVTENVNQPDNAQQSALEKETEGDQGHSGSDFATGISASTIQGLWQFERPDGLILNLLPLLPNGKTISYIEFNNYEYVDYEILENDVLRIKDIDGQVNDFKIEEMSESSLRLRYLGETPSNFIHYGQQVYISLPLLGYEVSARQLTELQPGEAFERTKYPWREAEIILDLFKQQDIPDIRSAIKGSWVFRPENKTWYIEFLNGNLYIDNTAYNGKNSYEILGSNLIEVNIHDARVGRSGPRLHVVLDLEEDRLVLTDMFLMTPPVELSRADDIGTPNLKSEILGTWQWNENITVEFLENVIVSEDESVDYEVLSDNTIWIDDEVLFVLDYNGDTMTVTDYDFAHGGWTWTRVD